jgi:nucleotide-binding universal stress UspA family protein
MNESTIEPLPTNRIVVGVDGSYYSKFALKWAAYLAKLSGAGIDAMLVWQSPLLHSREWTTSVPRDQMRADMEKGLTEAVDEVFGENRPPELRLLVQEGSTPTVLIDRSKVATMLVVGSRGHGGFANLLLGSVSTKCVQHAHCPVLVIHGNEPPPLP